jgi:tetratricopeptide (TPR) repeat protein
MRHLLLRAFTLNRAAQFATLFVLSLAFFAGNATAVDLDAPADWGKATATNDVVSFGNLVNGSLVQTGTLEPHRRYTVIKVADAFVLIRLPTGSAWVNRDEVKIDGCEQAPTQAYFGDIDSELVGKQIIVLNDDVKGYLADEVTCTIPTGTVAEITRQHKGWIYVNYEKACWIKLQDTIPFDPQIAKLTEQLKKRPDPLRYQRRGVLLEAAESDWFAARDFLSAAQENGNAYLDLGKLLFRNNEDELAEKYLSDSIRESSDKSEAYYYRGMLRFKKENFEQASKDFEKVIKLEPSSPRGLCALGLIYSVRGMYDRALESFSEAIAIDPMQAHPYIGRAEIWEQLQQYNKAIDEYSQAIEIKPDDADTISSRAMVYFETKQFRSAIADFEHALAIQPDNHYLWNFLGLAHSNIGEYGKAQSCHKMAMDNGIESWLTDYGNGRAFLGDKTFHIAVIAFTKAIDQNPTLSLPYEFRGRTRFKMRKYKEAIEDFSCAISIEDTNYLTYYWRALARHETGEFRNAIKDFTHALELQPSSIFILVDRANSYLALGLLDEAIADFENALTISPGESHIQTLLEHAISDRKHLSKLWDVAKPENRSVSFGELVDGKLKKLGELDDAKTYEILDANDEFVMLRIGQQARWAARTDLDLRFTINAPAKDEKGFRSHPLLDKKVVVIGTFAKLVNGEEIVGRADAGTELVVKRVQNEWCFVDEAGGAWIHASKIALWNPTIALISTQLRDNPTAQLFVDRASLWLELGETQNAFADCLSALELDPDHADSMIIVGRCYRLQKAYRKSVDSFTKAIKLEPGSSEAALGRIRTWLEMGETRNAHAEIEKLTELHPDVSVGYRAKAEAMVMSENYDDAIQEYSKAIEIDPTDPSLFIDLASVWESIDIEEAIASYSDAIKIQSENHQARINRGRCYLETEKYDNAIADFTFAIDAGAPGIDGLFERGKAHFANGEFDSALADFSKVIHQRPELATAYFWKAKSLYELQELASALQALNKAIEISPELAGVYYQRGTIWKDQGETNKAITDFTAEIRRTPDAYNAYSDRGFLWIQKRNFEEVIDDLTMATKLAPWYSYNFYVRGAAWQALKRFDKAIEDFDEALRFGEFADALVKRGMCWRELDQYGKAQKDFDRAIQIAPEFADAYVHRARVWESNGNYDKAIEDLTTAIKLDPTNPFFYSSRADSWANKNELAKAVADVEKAIELDPANSYQMQKAELELAINASNVSIGTVYFKPDSPSFREHISDSIFKNLDSDPVVRLRVLDASEKEVLLEHRHFTGWIPKNELFLLPRVTAPARDQRGNQLGENAESRFIILDRAATYAIEDSVLGRPKLGEVVTVTREFIDDGNKWYFTELHGGCWVSEFHGTAFDPALNEINLKIAEKPTAQLLLQRAKYMGSLLNGIPRHDHIFKLCARADIFDAIKLEPANEEIYLQLALARDWEPQELNLIYSKVIHLNPTRFEAYFQRGKTFSEMGEYRSAITDLTFVIDAQPENWQALLERGKAWMLLEKPKNAVKDLDECLKLNDKCLEAIGWRGEALYKQGQYDSALTDFNKLIESGSGFGSAYLNRGLVWQKKELFDNAIADFTTLIEKQPDQIIGYACRSKASELNGDIDAAIEDMSAAINIDPSPGAYYFRGLLWIKKRDHTKAIDDFTEAIKLNTNHVDSYAARANAWFFARQYSAALEDYMWLVKNEPWQVKWKVELANCYIYLNQTQIAIDYLENALKLPQHAAGEQRAELHRLIAWTFATCPISEFRDGSLAVTHATEACDLTDWKDDLKIETLAAAYATNGQFVEALDSLEMAIKLGPQVNRELREKLRFAIERKKAYIHFRD